LPDSHPAAVLRHIQFRILLLLILGESKWVNKYLQKLRFIEFGEINISAANVAESELTLRV
jgi:hypothetical protein